MIGTSLNQYRITASIGAGGMGEVFRARDTRLNRDVAIKVLPKDFAGDANRLRRFEQESKTLAALNHPNVLTIHDAGVHEGAPYLVSELLEGRTLREEMNGGVLPVRKATEYALQIAHGLAAAHGKGITHRDLKPENIFVTKDGRVKILDFGLAKLRNPSPLAGERENDMAASVDAETLIHTTEPGLVLGTPAYMSPEQVRGEAADHRSDIFAFGCVLYEMLSGTRAFRRDTPVASMNAVLSEDPPELSATNPNIPLALERLVRRCLEKPLERRFQTASDLAFALENLTGSSGLTLAAARPEAHRSRLVRSMFLWITAGLGIALAIFAGLVQRDRATLNRGSRSSTAQVRKFEIVFPPPTKTNAQNRVEGVQISPDGRKLIYQNADGLWVRWLDAITPPVLLSRSARSGGVGWSPQSTEVAFIDEKKLYRLSISGGTPSVICTLRDSGAAPAWLNDDRILFQKWDENSQEQASNFYYVAATGGDPKLAMVGSQYALHFHEVVPLRGRQGALVIVHRRGQSDADTIGVFDGVGSMKTVLQLPGASLTRAVYSPTGHVLYGRENENQGLWAFAFTLEKLERVGEPFRVSDYGAEVSVADDGTVVSCAPQQAPFGSRQLVWVDRTGKTTTTVGTPARGMSSPRLSPDERQIAIVTRDTMGAEKIGIVDTARGILMPLTRSDTRERGSDSGPFWFPDGERLLFTRFSQGTNYQVLIKRIDGFGPEEELLKGSAENFSRNGQYLIIARANGRAYVRLDGNQRNPVPFPDEFKSGGTLKLSSDARLLAYRSWETEQNELYVFGFPDFRNRTLIARATGQGTQWSRSSSELFYLDDRSLMSVKVILNPAGSLEIGKPVKIFDLPEGMSRFFEVAADDERFLMLKDAMDETKSKPITAVLVQNWFEEFREKK